RDVYLNEARRWGVRILPMDVNESGIKYRGSGSWMRPGFMHVRNIRGQSLEAMVEARRREGPFRDLVDFTERVEGMHKGEIERLILVGGFDGFGLSQPESMFLLDDVFDAARGWGEGAGLFDGVGVLPAAAAPRVPQLLTDYNLAQRCLNELALLGYMLSGDILEILELHPASKGATPAREISRFSGQRVKVFGRQVTERMHRVQRTLNASAGAGEAMMFLTLEDRSESVDVI
ncbi:uncharacterized protein METZ01_LOCUS505804, partial [marine metagenome]